MEKKFNGNLKDLFTAYETYVDYGIVFLLKQSYCLFL